MRKVLLIMLLSGGLVPARAQIILKGKVVDQTSGEPLENAVVSVSHGPSSLTDPQGNFLLRVAHPADSIRVSFVGYTGQAIAAANATGPFLVRLAPGRIDLRSVTVQALPGNASFSTISNIDLHLHALNTSQDLMRLVPGLSLMQHQGGGIADHIFYRGFDADHGTDVSVFVDGMPLNLPSQAHGQGFADLHFVIPELVTSLEYGKGPYYADRGDFTTAAYLAFRTTDVLEKNEVKLEGGLFNTGRIFTAVNLLGDRARARGESAYIAGEGFYTDGPFDYGQHFNRGNLFGKYIAQVSRASQVRITVSTFNSIWRSSGEIPLRAVEEGLIGRWGYADSAQGGNTDRTTAIVRLTTAVSDRTQWTNQAYYARYFFNVNYDQTFFKDDPVNGDQLRQRESRDLYGYNSKFSHRVYLGTSGTLTSSAGLGFQMNQIHGSELSHTKDYNDVLDYLQHGDIREWTLGSYLDEQYRAGRWLFDAGARFDYLNTFYKDFLHAPRPAVGKGIASPKASAEFTLNNRFQLYARAGKGFHSNDAKAMAENRGLDVLPAAYGFDLGLNCKPLPRLYLNIAAWYLYLQQEFTYNADDGTFSPGDKTRREGADFSARYEFRPWLYADFDLNLCRARDAQLSKGKNYLPLSVPFYSSAGLYVKLPSGISGGWSARYMKDRPATSDNSLVAKGYFLNDLTAYYRRHGYEVGLEIQNIFDSKWMDAQYEVESRLRGESAPVDDISFTPGTPVFAKLIVAVFF